jgi:hypothetical protein
MVSDANRYPKHKSSETEAIENISPAKNVRAVVTGITRCIGEKIML